MTVSRSSVFIVDDDAGALKALGRLLRAAGYDALTFGSPQAFLAHHDASLPGCAVFDVAMPGLDGLQLQSALTVAGIQRPIIFITGRADVPTSVRAMKAGAVDFLTKPVNDRDLLAAIARAIEEDTALRQARAELDSVENKLTSLTPREREVFTHVVAGRLNKQIAADLGTVERTVKVHRSRMMEKMGVRTVADLVRLAERIQPARRIDRNVPDKD
jgi:FixJ family two-component response regulator